MKGTRRTLRCDVGDVTASFLSDWSNPEAMFFLDLSDAIFSLRRFRWSPTLCMKNDHDNRSRGGLTTALLLDVKGPQCEAIMVGTTKKDDKKKSSNKDEISPEETASPYPPMKLAQTMHRLTVKDDLELQIQTFDEIIQELENPSLYKSLKEKLYDGKDPLPASAKLTSDDLKVIEEKNQEKLKELEAAVEEAVESAGDMEVMDARLAVARFASRALSQKEALAAYDKVLALPKVSSGKKIDSLMACARVASFYSDTAGADNFVDRAHRLAEAGGGADWDRRNRLKVYRALQRLLHRDLQTAAGLLLDCIATFSCAEMCTYTEFIVYAVLTNMLHLPRPELKKKIIDGPEVLSVSKEIPEVVSASFALLY